MRPIQLEGSCYSNTKGTTDFVGMRAFLDERLFAAAGSSPSWRATSPSAQRRKRNAPGALVYFGGAVHEVLKDGYTVRERSDLVPDSPKSAWRPKWTKRRRR